MLGLVVTCGLGSWLGWLVLAVLVLSECALYHLRLQAFLQRNLTPEANLFSTNMPVLFTHLCQLEAAEQIIKFHVSRSTLQNGKANAASVSSNLALMQAMRHCRLITTNLEARLVSAYNRCFRGHSASCHQYHLDVEVLLASTSSKPDSLQRIKDSMMRGAMSMPAGLMCV